MRGGRLEDFTGEAFGTTKGTQVSIRETSKEDKYCVLADILIPGKGDPIKDGCLVVEGKKINFAGKASEMQDRDSNLPKTHVKVLMPGMWDCKI